MLLQSSCAESRYIFIFFGPGYRFNPRKTASTACKCFLTWVDACTEYVHYIKFCEKYCTAQLVECHQKTCLYTSIPKHFFTTLGSFWLATTSFNVHLSFVKSFPEWSGGSQVQPQATCCTWQVAGVMGTQKNRAGRHPPKKILVNHTRGLISGSRTLQSKQQRPDAEWGIHEKSC